MINVSMSEFKQLVTLASAFTNEATFTIEDERMSINVLDTTHIALATGSIDASYTTKIDSFTVNAEQLLKALPIISDNATMDIKDGKFIIKGDKSKVSLPLIYSDVKSLKVPNINTVASATITPSKLKNLLTYASSNKTDHLHIGIDDGNLKITVGSESDAAELEGDNIGFGTATTGFSLNYVIIITDLANKCKSDIRIELGGNDRPARFIWKDGTAEYCVLLAPRIEE